MSVNCRLTAWQHSGCQSFIRSRKPQDERFRCCQLDVLKQIVMRETQVWLWKFSTCQSQTSEQSLDNPVLWNTAWPKFICFIRSGLNRVTQMCLQRLCQKAVFPKTPAGLEGFWSYFQFLVVSKKNNVFLKTHHLFIYAINRKYKSTNIYYK